MLTKGLCESFFRIKGGSNEILYHCSRPRRSEGIRFWSEARNSVQRGNAHGNATHLHADVLDWNHHEGDSRCGDPHRIATHALESFTRGATAADQPPYDSSSLREEGRRRSHYEGGSVGGLNDFGGGEGLARSGDPEQDLMLLAIEDAAGERFD